MDILTNFGVQPQLLLAQIVNFLIIFFILKKFFYGKITKALDDRKQKIEESLNNADLIEQKLQKTEDQTAKLIDDARKQAKEIIGQANTEAQRLTDESLTQARQIQEETLKESQSQIEAEKVQMKKQLEKDTLNPVIEVVEKVLGRTLKQKEQEELTTKAAQEMTKQVH